MNTLDIVIIVAVVILVIMMMKPKLNKKHKKRRHRHKEKYYDGSKRRNSLDDQFSLSDLDLEFDKNEIDMAQQDNYNFVESRNHMDYKDMLIGIDQITPQKTKFNLCEKPVTITSPSRRKILRLIKTFITELNNKTRVTYKRPTKLKSGWEKHMESLGLPSSLYKEDADFAELELMKIIGFKTFETSDEMRISCKFTAKKTNVRDKVLLRVDFWVDKRDVNDDRDFFKDKEHHDDMEIEQNELNEELPIQIEHVFVEGYYIKDTDNNDSDYRAKRDFNNYDEILGKNGMSDTQKLLKSVTEKRRKRGKLLNTTISDDLIKSKYSEKYNIMDDVEFDKE